MGLHVLHAARCQEDGGGNSRMGLEPCGFCGRDGQGCLTQLKVGPKGGIKIFSTCPYKYEALKYKEARESTTVSPCSNVPIHCPLCPKSVSGEPKTIWKYNAVFHIADKHPQTPIPVGFMRQFFIHAVEEARMGIVEEDTREFREQAGLKQGSDDLAAMGADQFAPPLSSAGTAPWGRDRAGTVTQASFQWHEQRTR